MASSQSENQDHHQQPKKESCQSSSNTNDPPPPPPPQMMGYPPMMGYPHPPPMGYPPGPATQSGYPPPLPGQAGAYHNYNAYNNNYPYTQAPPAAYYHSHMYQVQQETPVSAFLRVIIGGLMLLIMFMCISSFLTWLILRPAIPLIHLNTLSASNFNASSPSLFTANWDVNITVENHNSRLQIYFDQVEVFIYYDKEDLLASTYARPFMLETQQNGVIETTLKANNSDHSRAGVGNWVVEKIVTDKRISGKVKFGLRMGTWSTFKSGTWWARHVNLLVYCKDLVVAFDGNSGNGHLADSKGTDCLVLLN